MFIEQTNTWLLVGAALALAGLALGAWSSRLGVPFLLVFLVVGMLAGEDGPGAIEFDDTRLSFVVGNLALAVILFDGGLRTRAAALRVALVPALVLATVGVAVTAALVAAVAVALLGLDWRVALLLGAIVGSTDAAAVFALLKSSGLRLNERVANTLEAESGLNDPMAVFLTVALVSAAIAAQGGSAQDAGLAALVLEFVRQFGIGALAGFALGWLLVELMKRVELADGLNALMLAAGGVTVFATTNLLGGSGFLAVYLAGLLAGNRRRHASPGTMQALDGLAWLAQSGMFLLLGLLVTPRELVDMLLPALGIAAFLMFAARPLAVALCLAPLGFGRREIVFIGWVGLRGAVPIVLAMFPLFAGLSQAGELFKVAFVVVLASLLLQGTTIAWTARRTGVALPPRPEPLARAALVGADGTEVLQFEVPSTHPWIGVMAQTIELPASVTLLGVLRDGRLLRAEGVALRAADGLLLGAPEAAVERVAELLRAGEAAPATALRFVLTADTPLSDVLALYAPARAAGVPPELTLETALRAAQPEPVEGDTVHVHGVRLSVVQMRGAAIERIALEVDPLG